MCTFLFLYTQNAYSQVIIKKVIIAVGNSENSIKDDGEPFGGGLPTTHFCVDGDLNIFIIDNIAHEIKKFNINGKFLGKIITPNSIPIEITCFENTVHLIGNRYLFFMGYKEKDKNERQDGIITINIIDLKTFFPDLNFPTDKIFKDNIMN
ncbi:MAG: hypothetical protein GF313_11120 [Caldithrix sp.]|nr:hypothetical protein [Caldithrix sp.]